MYLDGFVTTQDHVGLKISVNGGSCNGQNPRSIVHNRVRARSRIPSRASHHDAALHGVERSDRNRVARQVG